MVESTVEPDTLEIQRVVNGKVELLVHWNIQKTKREDEMTDESQALYQYEECRLKWILPKSYSTKSGVMSYLKSIESEIIDWAKGSKVSLS